MDKNEKIIDLKMTEKFTEEYVSLRNHYCEFLLTKPVNVLETRAWLKSNGIEVRGIVGNATLLGAVILYLKRKGEIAFFAKDQNRGIGSKLLKIIEKVAKENNLKSVWAWVLSDNLAAQKTFQKNGYTLESQSSRSYEKEERPGVIYRKEIY